MLNDISRVEDNLLDFVASREARVVTVNLPDTPDTPFDVKHGLITNVIAKVRYQVLEATEPLLLYAHPRDVIGPDFFRLRSTASGGQVRLLLTKDEGDSVNLDLPNNTFTIQGVTFSGGRMYEGNRAYGNGEWKDVDFDASNFTGNGAMTWTVDAGDVTTNRYTRIGDTLMWEVIISDTLVGGTPDTMLKITLPDGLTAASLSHFTPVGYASDNGVAVPAFFRVVDANTVAISKTSGTAWSAGAAYIYGTMIISLA